MKYRMYIDEVGNSDLNSSDNPLHRFLSLTGIIVDLQYVRDNLFPDMENLKAKFFNSHPDEPLIFHRKELVNAKPPFSALRDEETQRAFDRDLLGYLNDWEYVYKAWDRSKKSDIRLDIDGNDYFNFTGTMNLYGGEIEDEEDFATKIIEELKKDGIEAKMRGDM